MVDKKVLVQRIVNVCLLVLFVVLLINSIIIQFALVQPLSEAKEKHIWLGWLFFLFMSIHILLHLNYYKMALMFWRKND